MAALRYLAVLIPFIAYAALPARAADIRLDGAGDIQMSGPIEAGDADKLRLLLDQHGPQVKPGHPRSLVLQGNGGPIKEADRIISVFWQDRHDGAGRDYGPLRTIVPKNAACLSSCAIIFMHGQGPASDTHEYAPARAIHASGVLGFHAPYLTSERMNNTVQENNELMIAGIKIFNSITKRGAIPNELSNEFLNHGQDSTLNIDTLHQAAKWEIGVFLETSGQEPSTRLNVETAYTACYRLNDPDHRREARDYAAYLPQDYTNKVQFLDRYGAKKNVYKVKVDVDAEATNACFIWTDKENDLVYEMDGDDETVASWLNAYPPGLKLGELQAFQSSPTAAAPAPDVTASVDRTAPDAAGPPAPEGADITWDLGNPNAVMCNPSSGFSNIRNGPSGKGELLDRIANGVAIKVISISRNPESGHAWFRVQFPSGGRERVGYVDHSFISRSCSIAAAAAPDDEATSSIAPFEEEAGPAPVPAPEPAPPALAMVCNSAADFANLRRGPGPSHGVVRKLENGSAVELIGEARNPDSGQLWYRIRSAQYGSIEGYIDSDYIRQNCGSNDGTIATPSEPEENSITAKVCNPNSVYSNVRSGPSPSYGVVARLANDHDLRVTGSTANAATGNQWFEVRFGQAGAIVSGFIDATSVSRDCQNPVRYVERIVCNAKSGRSNVRDGAGPANRLAGQLANGDRIYVVGASDAPSGQLWFELRGPSGEALFIDSDAVRANCPKEILARRN